MTNRISKPEFRANVTELLRQIEASGESLFLTDNDLPVLEVRAVQPDKGELLKTLQNAVLRYDNPFEPVGEDDWEAIADSA